MQTTGTGLRIPTRPDELTVDVLEPIIREMHPEATLQSCETVDVRGRGEMVSTAGRVKLRVTYGPGSPPLPEQVLVKMTIEGDGMSPMLYETECKMHHRMLPPLPIERPRCLGTAYEPETLAFILILEDLTARQAFFPNSTEPPLRPEQVGKLLDLLATIHAHYWNSPKLAQESGWLSGLAEGRQAEFFDLHVVRRLDDLVATVPYRADLLTRLGRTPFQLWEGLKAVQRYHAKTIPATLLHGDTGAHNTYHLPDGTCGYLDWQLSARGAWPHDVHYLIVTALSVKDRRKHERNLLQRYLKRLASLGVDEVPTLEEAIPAFGRALMWGFTIGWLLVPVQNYPAEIIQTNLERISTAMLDHGTLALADEVMSA